MKRILANDGIAADGKAALEAAGFEVVTEKIAQEDLPQKIGAFDVLIVRSATKVNRQVLENPGNLKLVVRAGVGIDNIDVEAAKANGVDVSNTPNSSSLSVAELVFAHIFSLARFLHESHRQMPEKGSSKFKDLKKVYEKGTELRGKTLGIVGGGRIGQETAKIGIGLGMNVLIFNRTPKIISLKFDHLPFKPFPALDIKTTSLEEVLKNSDYVSLHVPHETGKAALIGANELAMMKNTAGLINCARGGAVDEDALAYALNNKQIAYAGLDVFVNEPEPRDDLLKVPGLSLTPHIGASTAEAQDRVSLETAALIIEKMNA
ncbi:MAG: D-2-hydroxyacid dehydrogenase [Bacteroidota bacterium]|nr:D-2-hydroxyacid dehydrogenase [Bacteroidota bacterium]